MRTTVSSGDRSYSDSDGDVSGLALAAEMLLGWVALLLNRRNPLSPPSVLMSLHFPKAC